MEFPTLWPFPQKGCIGVQCFTAACYMMQQAVNVFCVALCRCSQGDWVYSETEGGSGCLQNTLEWSNHRPLQVHTYYTHNAVYFILFRDIVPIIHTKILNLIVRESEHIHISLCNSARAISRSMILCKYTYVPPAFHGNSHGTIRSSMERIIRDYIFPHSLQTTV